MKWQETHHSVEQKQEAKRMSVVPDAYSPERAAKYAELMFKRRVEGWGDETNALEDVARWCGLSARSLKRLIKGERKVLGIDVYGRIHRAYLQYCLTLISQLKHEVEIDGKVHGHAAVADIFDEVEALEAKAEAALAIAQTERIRS